MDDMKRLEISLKSIRKVAEIQKGLIKEAGSALTREVNKGTPMVLGAMGLAYPKGVKINRYTGEKLTRGKNLTRVRPVPALVREGREKEYLLKKSSVTSADATLSGLKQASLAIYENTYASRMGIEKQAGLVESLLQGVGAIPKMTEGLFGTAATAGGAAALGLGAARARNLSILGEKSVRGAAARRAMGAKNRARLTEEAAAKASGKTYIPKPLDRSAQEVEFFRKMQALKASGKTLKDAPMEYMKAYGPEVARAALEGGGATALTGAAARFAANLAKRKKIADTVRAAAIPAAVGGGLGMYALS
jgi:hypothetical protein